MSARFEIVRNDAGWFARFIATNGREVWRTSETYTRKIAAVRACSLIDTGAVDDLRYVDERASLPCPRALCVPGVHP